jgi:hypothetical protein
MRNGQFRPWQKALIVTAAVLVIIAAVFGLVQGFRQGWQEHMVKGAQTVHESGTSRRTWQALRRDATRHVLRFRHHQAQGGNCVPDGPLFNSEDGAI